MSDAVMNVAAVVPTESLGEARSVWRTLGLYAGRRPPFALRLAPPGAAEPTHYGEPSTVVTRDQFDTLEALRVLGKAPAGLVVGEGILPELLKRLKLVELPPPPPPPPPPKPKPEPAFVPWLRTRAGGWRELPVAATLVAARAALQAAAVGVPVLDAVVLEGGTGRPDEPGGGMRWRGGVPLNDPEHQEGVEEVAKKLHAAEALVAHEGVPAADVEFVRLWATTAAAGLKDATRGGKSPDEMLGWLNGIARAADSRLLEMVASAADTLRQLLGSSSRRVREAATAEVGRLAAEVQAVAPDSQTSAIMSE